ncbi:uncharacterized protein LOC143445793 [Clavelina lepadiformis]|uniref:uncharacterized protein LOC143445793 n=1 Tax=Clavelina lepadiformis TaxID=159417 RepID=UPI00404208B0
MFELSAFKSLLLLLLFAHLMGSEGFLFRRKNRKHHCTVTPWTSWKNCRPLPTGRSVETRTRYLSPARNGGKVCKPNTNTEETRDCSSSPGGSPSNKVATIVLQTTITALMSSSFSSSSLRGVPSSENSNMPREGSSGGKYCNVIKNSNGEVIASGSCGPRRGIRKRSVDDNTTWFRSFSKRFRRQLTEEKLRDVVILMDKSGSIRSRENMQTVKDIAAAIVHAICDNIALSSDRTRIGVAAFDHGFYRLIELDQYTNEGSKAELENAIKNLPIKYGGRTHLTTAMERTRTEMLRDNTRGARHNNPRVRKMIFVISDGCANGPGPSPEKVKNNYMNENSCIVSIFIGSETRKCRSTMEAFDTNCSCFQQFFYSTWLSAREDFVDVIAEIPPGECPTPTWRDLLLDCNDE